MDDGRHTLPLAWIGTRARKERQDAADERTLTSTPHHRGTATRVPRSVPQASPLPDCGRAALPTVLTAPPRCAIARPEHLAPALVQAGAAIGTIKEQSRLAGYVVIRTRMSLFPPKNPATVRVSVKKTGDTQTEVSFQSDSLGGIVGFGSAGKGIDEVVRELESALS